MNNAKDYKRCFNRESGKVKTMSPAFYNNAKMMARLGWEVMPEVEELDPLTPKIESNVLHKPSEADKTKKADLEVDPKKEIESKMKQAAALLVAESEKLEKELKAKGEALKKQAVIDAKKKIDASKNGEKKPDNKPKAGKRNPQKQATA